MTECDDDDFFLADDDTDVIGVTSMSAEDSKSANLDDFLRIRPDLDTSIVIFLKPDIRNFILARKFLIFQPNFQNNARRKIIRLA